MDIIPAIDLREGSCARIISANDPSPAVWSDDAVEQAVILKELGAEWVHITDLDGAFSGHLCNLDILQEIINVSGLHIQHHGGARTMDHIETLIDMGVERVVVGSAILRNHDLAEQAFHLYGEKIVPGVDGLDGMVAIEGFETAAATSVIKLLNDIKTIGFKRILYTDRRRCGVMRGPNYEAIGEIIGVGGLRVMIAGGINSYEAISKLKDMGAGSLVIGKALYTGALDLQRARSLSKQ